MDLHGGILVSRFSESRSLLQLPTFPANSEREPGSLYELAEPVRLLDLVVELGGALLPDPGLRVAARTAVNAVVLVTVNVPAVAGDA